MADVLVILVGLGLLAFVLVTITEILAHLIGWVYRVFVFPRRDAEESFRQFQDWQAVQLEDTPYMVTPRDPTRPEEDADGLSPLVELWRRGQ